MIQLPEGLLDLFWDQDPARLSWRPHRSAIIVRLLEAGGWDAVRWLRDHVTSSELRECIERREGRGLSPARLRFWELILGLPHDTVTAWVQRERTSVWGRRTIS